MKNEIGTLTTLPEAEERKLRRLRTGGNGPGGGSGKRGGGGGGGGDRRDNNNSMDEQQPFAPTKYRLTMAFILVVIAMTFAGLIGAYIVIAYNRQLEWRPFDLPFQVWVSTLLILGSSAAYEIAKTSLYQEKQESFRLWLMITLALGGAFIASQLLAWLSLVNRGVYVASHPYAGFFYVLTATHALHLVGGIGALGYMILRAWHPTAIEEKLLKRKTAATVVGWYWHSMDVLWLILVSFLVFWK